MRLARLLAVPAIAGVMLAFTVAASPAYAGTTDLACNYDYVTFNACLNFQETDPANDMWSANVGLDALMPERYAQEIVAYGAGFRATLWGDDNGQGTFIADLSISPGWPLAGSDRLSGHLTATLTREQLNEDANYDEDELYAIVSYFDYHTGTTKVFRTGTVHGYFDPVGSGDPGCFVVCR
jgi:hypothetical protein